MPPVCGFSAYPPVLPVLSCPNGAVDRAVTLQLLGTVLKFSHPTAFGRQPG